MNRQEMTPQRALKITKTLFFSGLGLMLLGVMIGSVADNAYLILFIAVLGSVCAFGGLIFGNMRVRCPDCCRSLMMGGRVPGDLPCYCPHCGKRL